MKQFQSQINQQFIGKIPTQLSNSYKQINGQILAFQNLIQLNKDSETHLLKILSPHKIKAEKSTKMFGWNINFSNSTSKLYTNEEFFKIYQYNCFLLGDCYKANSLQYIENKYRKYESYFLQDQIQRINLLLEGDQMQELINFKINPTQEHSFKDYKQIYINKKNPLITFSVYDLLDSNQPALIFFERLIYHNAFEQIEQALEYYGLTQNDINQMNIHQLLQCDKITLGNMNSYRQNYSEYFQQIALCSYTLHVNQFHKNVQNIQFSSNICEQCESGDSNTYCTCIKSITPLKQPQIIPLQFLQLYPVTTKYVDIVCCLYHSLICQFKIWTYQDSVEQIIGTNIAEESIITSFSNGLKNYENLELLGDSILKYVVSADLFLRYEELDEGELTSLRSRIIQNQFLSQLFETLGIQNYIVNSDLHFKQIKNPLIEELKSSEEKPLQISQMADIYEAIIGGVFEKNENLYDYLSILRKTNFPISIEKNSLYDYIPLDDSRVSFMELKDYKFKNQKLYELALDQGQYEKLEFLGDAAIEMLVVTYLFKTAKKYVEKHPKIKITPGILSSLKQELLNNKFMSEMTMNMKLLPRIEEPSKMYADIFESVGAAILIDSGWIAFNNVFGKIYKEQIEQFLINKLQ